LTPTAGTVANSTRIESSRLTMPQVDTRSADQQCDGAERRTV
jgi:hypothetical protein